MNQKKLQIDLTVDLLRWYDEHARILPWRSDPAPYRVWVSEIMLQQTRVEAVKPYFDRFLSLFPTIEDLAYADEESVMKAWQGLGYYRRAANLQKAAKIVSESYDGNLPSSYTELQKLPGIGEYTASAIASIAYGEKQSVVDGNVLRVIARLTADETDITKPAAKKTAKEMLMEIIPEDRAGDFNQAMMELGATVCLPNGEPLCGQCPLSLTCLAYENGNQTDYPVKAKKKARKRFNKTILLFRYRNKIAIRKRTEEGVLQGLWEFPNTEGHLTQEELFETYGDKITLLGKTKHIFTHLEWHMLGYQIEVDDPSDVAFDDLVWVTKTEMEEIYAIPNAFGYYKKKI